ncbi:hypothetical protein D5086_010135 [Populus alba]|uniref:Uncharacterized protein n=1 Tax=Populus alba TaxID=43335 RepID=A0ACC4CAD4_POPAL
MLSHLIQSKLSNASLRGINDEISLFGLEKIEIDRNDASYNLVNALQVSEHYKQVIATDISEEQLKHAIRHPQVQYFHSPSSMSDDELVNLIGGENSVDLVVVATAVHWFDLEKFYPVVKRVLKKPGGVGCEGQPLELDMPMEMSFERLLKLLSSASAVNAAKEQGMNLLSEEVVRELESAWGGPELLSYSLFTPERIHEGSSWKTQNKAQNRALLPSPEVLIAVWCSDCIAVSPEFELVMKCFHES